jgi:nucleobase transporter 1/2
MAVAGILTAAGVYDNASKGRQESCRTDQLDAVHDAPWFYVPYPLQWGTPIFRPASIITMLAGALAAMIESVSNPPGEQMQTRRRVDLAGSEALRDRSPFIAT